ncbi:MAG: acetate kinase [Clostridia bacterium]|nr:acetate kinase [Clostridia bacterium]
MKVLVINAGSSTLKYQLIDMDTEEMICKGNCEKIGDKPSDGEEGSFIKYSKAGIEKTAKEYVDIPNHRAAFEIVIQKLTTGEYKVIDSLEEITAIGHRVVHGKDFIKPTLITDEIITELENLVDYAPLHIPGAVTGMKACREIAPTIPNVAVFDTAYHTSMSEVAKTYAIPKALADTYGIKRYGAHGSSHKYIASEVEKLLGKKEYKLISCHIGSGASLCAIKDGKCVDTSMGFTPLAGLVMGKRSGDIDPSVISFISNKTGKTAQQVIDMLNNESGLIGLCGENDSRSLEIGMKEGKPNFKLAFDVMILSIIKYIGAYVAELDGLDALVFTAGIGENSPLTRKSILDRLTYLGITYDEEVNNKVVRLSNNNELSLADSKVKVYVVPTNEELVIARDTLEIVNQK